MPADPGRITVNALAVAEAAKVTLRLDSSFGRKELCISMVEDDPEEIALWIEKDGEIVNDTTVHLPANVFGVSVEALLRFNAERQRGSSERTSA